MQDGDRISVGICSHIILVRRDGIWWPTDALYGTGLRSYYTDEQVKTEFDPNNSGSRYCYGSLKYEPKNGG